MHNAPGKKKRRSGKTTYFIIPTIRQSGKGKTYGDTAKMEVSSVREEGRINRWNTEFLVSQNSETILYDI